MDRKDFSNLGEDIKEIVSEAVNNMDFNKLSQDIKKTTKDALEEAKAGLEAGKLKMQNRYGQARKVADLEKIYNAEGQNENLSQESQNEPKTEHRIQPGIERPWNNEAKQKGVQKEVTWLEKWKVGHASCRAIHEREGEEGFRLLSVYM